MRSRVSARGEQALGFSQAVLASEVAAGVNRLLSHLVDGPATVAGKAMDAAYNASHIGGGYHRLFDGSHTVVGAFSAVRDASPDDSLFQGVKATTSELFKDLVTPNGLPIFTWSKETFDGIASTLDSTLHIPKSLVYGIVTVNAARVLGGGLGGLSVWLSRNDLGDLSKVVGRNVVFGVIGANPVLLIVSVPGLAKAIMDAKRDGEYGELVVGLGKGGVAAGAFWTVSAAATTLGAPAVIPVVAGVGTYYLVEKAMNEVDVVAVRDCLLISIRGANNKVRKANIFIRGKGGEACATRR